MSRNPDKYAGYVVHPKFGQRPLITGLNPQPGDARVQLHWNATTIEEVVRQYESVIGKPWPYGNPALYLKPMNRIPNTAIAANTIKQAPATVPVTHYFDLERKCRDCDRWFIFFAREQKYWYEELAFGLESDCVRCIDCRKTAQEIARKRELYESLFHVPSRTPDESVEMADACVFLMENDIFSLRQTERVRMLLNSIPDDSDVRKRSRFSDLHNRVVSLEARTETI